MAVTLTTVVITCADAAEWTLLLSRVAAYEADPTVTRIATKSMRPQQRQATIHFAAVTAPVAAHQVT